MPPLPPALIVLPLAWLAWRYLAGRPSEGRNKDRIWPMVAAVAARASGLLYLVLRDALSP